MDAKDTLSNAEQTALEFLARKHAVLVSQIDSTNSTDVFGNVVPGRGVFNKLIKKDLAYETQEPVLEDGFQFTPSIEITPKGQRLVKKLAQASAPPASRRRPQR